MRDGRCAEAIRWTDAITGSRPRSVGMVLETRTLEEVLLLTRSVFGTDLLAVYALHGHAFIILCDDVENVSRIVTLAYQNATYMAVTGDWGLEASRSRDLPFALNSTKAAWTSWSTVRPIMNASSSYR